MKLLLIYIARQGIQIRYQFARVKATTRTELASISPAFFNEPALAVNLNTIIVASATDFDANYILQHLFIRFQIKLFLINRQNVAHRNGDTLFAPDKRFRSYQVGSVMVFSGLREMPPPA